MGVLYAKVGGTWVPILGGTGSYLPLTGGTLSGPLRLSPTVDASYTSTGHAFQIGPDNGTNVAFDNNELVARNNMVAAGLYLHGDPVQFWCDGATLGQHINLYDGGWGRYGIGVQTGTQYYRGDNHAWYSRGSHVDTQLDPGAGGSVQMAILNSGIIIIGKTATSWTAYNGFELEPSGRMFLTSSVNQHNISINKRGTADVTGGTFISFNGDGTVVGNIARTASGVAYNQTSDYRLKREIGPVPEPVERLKQLRPVHFAWKTDDHVQDGFFAHEVAEVVPDAVTGDKDALTEEGEIAPQGLDNGRLVPLLTAALQQAVDRIETLEARITALEAAA
jgi:hypothetical protein